ncbi:DnaJ-domain-containing protein [Fistulina hepatica ATCC 64428]|uniref:DnaJ-domain-containing protein n=1 Tax=Fistulina hepatica ATCC 64428 TaxID=1128425 RepID=A0A0D7AD55_9AGAR|nr:DnaJ-domain-containing protein [Fistulina hepatica ATCC 64428]
MVEFLGGIPIPALPPDYQPPAVDPSVKPSGSVKRKILPAGPAFFSYARLALQYNYDLNAHDKRVAEEERRLQELNAANGADEDDLGVGDEPETAEILALDPKEWKKHDYYAVLGLSHLRYTATDEQIKIAHRKKVLKHHPDKKVTASGSSTPITASSLLAGVNLNTNDDAFFKCIQKAHEVLTHPEKRRQFDSVDPEFVESMEDDPKAADVKAKDFDFFKTYAPIYERESRFSRKQPVPQLGDIDSSKEHVEGFYDFWYNFDSWRSFEWLDKEVNEGSDSRDDKRYTEKKNKSERARRKKEDTARLRSLVDVTLSVDPRIKRIKQEEKAARDAKKAARSGTSTPRGGRSKEDEEKAKRAAEEAAKKKEEEEAVARAEAKKAKAAAANAAKKARRAARAAAGDTA